MDGCFGNYGIIYPELMATFDASDVITSMAGSLIVGVFLLFGPLDSFLINRLGCRTVCIIGGCVTMVGFVLASFASTMPVFMLTYGIMGGLGIGMSSLAGVIMVNTYFCKRRGIAGGIVGSGAGCGVLVLAPISQFLLQNYGWRGAMLIMGSIMFQLCACGALMRPLNLGNGESNKKDSYYKAEEMQNYNGKEKPSMITADEKKQPMMEINVEKQDLNYQELNIISSNNMNLDSDPNENRCKAESQILLENDSHNISVHSFVKQENQRTNTKSHKLIFESFLQDLAIFCDPLYIPILIGGFLIQMGQFIPNTFLPKYCDTIGLQRENVTVTLALFGAMNILGRLCAGILANTNIKCLSSLFLCNFSMVMCSVCCAMFRIYVSYWSLCLFAVGYGFFIGFFPTLQPLILVEYFGIEQLTTTIGFLQMVKGPAALIGPPLAGIVYEWTKQYTTTMEFAAVLFLLSACVQCLIPLINKFVKKKKLRKSDEAVVVLSNFEGEKMLNSTKCL